MPTGGSAAHPRAPRSPGYAVRHGTVRLWDTTTRELISEPLTGDDGTAVEDVVFSPDGTTLATRHIYGAVQLWDTITWEHIGELTSHDGLSVNAIDMAFSPDGAMFRRRRGRRGLHVWTLGQRVAARNVRSLFGPVERNL